MRVLIVHNRYRLAGGEERHVSLLEQGLTAAGVETRRFERSSASVGSSVGSRVAVAAGMTYRPSSARALAAELRSWRPDVVHAHNLWPLLTPSVLRAAKRAGVPVVHTFHNYRFACPSGTLLRRHVPHDDCVEGSALICGLRGARESLAEGLAYGAAIDLQRRLGLLTRWVDAFVAPSTFLKDILVRAGFPEQRVHAIAHGTPIDERSAAGGFALYAGRLSSEKGVETLLAASRLAPDVPLVVAGDGEHAAAIARAGGAIRYAGQLPADEVAALRRRAAFVVVPSECHEVLPFAAVEALAAGKSVIASRLGGLPEVVEDGISGVLVEPGAPEQLAAAMRDLWGDRSKAERMGAAGHRRAREQFSLAGQTARLVELYEAVA